jgi:hypothetical protein
VAKIFVQTVTHPKIGIAIPIANPSFEFWTDAAAVVDAQHWTAQGSIITARKENVSGVGNKDSIADEFSSIQLSGTSIPNNDTMRVISPALQYWHSTGPQLPASLVVYYSIYAHYVAHTTPGASVQFRFAIQTDDNAAMSSAIVTSLQSLVTSNGSLLRYNGSITTASAAGDRYAQFWLRLRDAAIMTVVVDEIGAMFDPIGNAGYVQLTNVYPANGPDFDPVDMVAHDRGVGGMLRRFDISGGARYYRIEYELVNEPPAVYETLRRYHALNKGMNGRPPLPLGLELNIPGIPPLLNVAMTRFNMKRQRSWSELYGGTIELETTTR